MRCYGAWRVSMPGMNYIVSDYLYRLCGSEAAANLLKLVAYLNAQVTAYIASHTQSSTGHVLEWLFVPWLGLFILFANDVLL